MRLFLPIYGLAVGSIEAMLQLRIKFKAIRSKHHIRRIFFYKVEFKYCAEQRIQKSNLG